MDWTEQEIEVLVPLPARERVQWAYEQFGEALVLSTSFGIQSAVMLHLAVQVNPAIPVIFIDTGYLFKETYVFANKLGKRLNLNLQKYQPLMSGAEQEALDGKLWEQGRKGLEKYNFIRKVEPMNRALQALKAQAWLTGLRRDQSSSREKLNILQLQNKTLKIHPVVDWTDRDVFKYLQKHDLPYHPLWKKGYVSVGDVHSTSKLMPGMRKSDTRFGGVKRECGLHEISNRVDFQI